VYSLIVDSSFGPSSSPAVLFKRIPAATVVMRIAAANASAKVFFLLMCHFPHNDCNTALASIKGFLSIFLD